MKTLVAMIGLFIFFVTILLILMKLSGLRERCSKMMLKIKNSMFWTAIIRSLDIAYLQIWMTVALQLQLRIKNSEF